MAETLVQPTGAPEMLPAFELPPVLSLLQHGVLNEISQGQTDSQAARHLAVGIAEVRQSKREIKQCLAPGSLARSVSVAIQRGLLAVEVQPDRPIMEQLSGMDRRMLGIYAKGATNNQVAEAGKLHIKVVENYHDRLLKKIGAWSRPHAIRRAYELGILSINEEE